jgi:hypothetical protein
MEDMTREEIVARLEELDVVEDEYHELLEMIEIENMMIYIVEEGFAEIVEHEGEYYLFPVGEATYLDIPTDG